MQKTKEQKTQRQRLVREHRKMETKLIEQGKTPYFLKRGDLRSLELAEEFERVKGRLGGAVADIDKLIEKKRKRKASKQKRLIPNRHEEG